MHTWRPFHLGKVRADGQFDIVWSLEKPVRPVPYPILRSRADWDAFLEKLRDRRSHSIRGASASRAAAIDPPRCRATDNPRGDFAAPRSKSVFKTQVAAAWLRCIERNGN